MKKLLFALLLIIITHSLFSKDIILASSVPYLGVNKELGINYMLGAKSYFDYINDNGGINGRSLRLLTANDDYNPELTVKNTIEFLENEDLLMLFNYVGTPTTNSILPLLKIREQDNLILFGNLTGAGSQRGVPYNDFVLNIRGSYSDETSRIVDYFLSIGKKRIGVFYQSDGFGQSGFSGIKESLNSKNLSVIAETTYKKEESWSSSMKEQALYLKEKNVDIIISVATSEVAAAFIRDARAIDLNVPISNMSFVDPDTLFNTLKSNSVSCNELYFSEVTPHMSDTQYSYIQKYNEIFLNKNISTSFISLEGFLNAYVLVEILKNTKYEINRSNIKKIIEEMLDIDLGLNINLAFSKDNHNLMHSVYIFKGIAGGGVVEVK